MSALNCSHRVINVYWIFCINFVVLLVTVAEIVQIVSSEKIYCHPSVLQEEACSFKYLVILDRLEVLSLSHLVGKRLKIVFLNGFYWGHTHIHVFSHLSCTSVPSLITFFVWAVFGLSLLGQSWALPNSLDLFITCYTMDLATFKDLIISEFVLYEQLSWIMTSRLLPFQKV